MSNAEFITPLTASEQQTLLQYEQIVAHGLKTFYEVGTALAAIREQRLYRQTHGTFEAYCRERWAMTAKHAARLIVAADVVDNLEPFGSILPSNLTHAYELSPLPPYEQSEAWQQALDTAPNGKVTAAHVTSVVEEFRGTLPPDRPSPEPEDSDARSGLVPSISTSPMAVHYSSATPEWYTPKRIIDLVLAFFDEIDLDPCSNSKDDPNVPAYQHYTEADDGLNQTWWGRVYMNPPYGRSIAPWVNKICTAYESHEIEAGIALLPARTDTEWFRRLRDYTICFIDGRLKFSGSENAAPFPSMVVYIGDEIRRFDTIFRSIGDVWTRVGGHPHHSVVPRDDDYDEDDIYKVSPHVNFQ